MNRTVKNVIHPFIVIIVLVAATPTFAQVKFGLKGGLNLTNMLAKDNNQNLGKDFYIKPGFHLGATAAFSMSKKFGLESGLLFSTKGYMTEFWSIKRTIQVNYLELPILAVYKIDLGRTNLLIHAGPYIGYALSGKLKANQPILGPNNDAKEEALKIGNDKLKDDIKPLDWGLNIGSAAEVNHITVGMQYGTGIANISAYTDNKTVIKNRVFYISLGYRFGKSY